MASFSAQVSAWVAKSERRTEAVFKESTQRVVSEMQKTRTEGGRMPVDTGFLRASLVPSINAIEAASRGNPGGSFSPDESDVTLKIANLELGDTFYAVYAANYARAVEYGAQGRAPAGFVAGATARWKPIVKAVSAELKTRIG